MAENTEEQQNTDIIAESITQIYNPFEQKEEGVSNQFVEESFFESVAPKTEGGNEGAQAQAQVQVQPEVEEEEEESEDPVEWLNDQWRDQGVKINDLNEIPAIIKEYHKLLAQKEPALSAEEQARIKLARETGNWNLYDQIVSVDTKSIDSRDAMKIKFLIENPQMPRTFAEQLFDKNLRKMFSDDDTEEFVQQYLDHEGAIARKWLEDKKVSINTAEESKVEKNTAEDDSNWLKGVDTVINQLAQDKYQITYELEDKSVNVVIDQEDVLELRNRMDNPQGWIRDNILNEQGGFDFEKLAQLILKDMHINKIASEYYELGRVHQEQHLLNKQRGTTTQATSTGSPKPNTDMRDNFAEVFHRFKTGF